MTCPIGNDIARAAEILKFGGLVAFATETVYGLGANALDVNAIARVFEVKQRPRFDPLIVHIPDEAGLERLVVEFPHAAKRLAEKFWPGPLTLVLKKTGIVPDLVTSGLPTVGVRIPDHPRALELLREVDLPIAAPSANLFGQVSPTTAGHVLEQLGEKIDYILDGGPCRVGLESTGLDLSGDRPRLLRPGGLPVEEIESLVGPVEMPLPPLSQDQRAKSAPGMLSKHYAPRTPLRIVEEIDRDTPVGRVGLLTFRPIDNHSPYVSVEVLSSSGNLTEAAANFFAALRRLDSQKLDLIVARPFPEQGLGRAMNDRLRRAAHE